jgi:hypothetical protein
MKTNDRVITHVPIAFSSSKKEYIFALNHTNPQPSIYEVFSDSDRRPTGVGNAFFPNTFSFICEDHVYDPATSTMRVIRYVKGEASIFTDEQSENDFAKAERLEFTQKSNGMITIPKSNKQLLQFLSMTDYNGSKEGRDVAKKALFRYLDESAIYNDELNKEVTMDKAKGLAINCSFDELMELALGLEPVIMTESREEQAIRWDLLQRAKADPAGFIAILANPDTKKKSNLRKAEKAGIIKKSNSGFAWANGQMFLIIPPGQNPYNFFVGQKSNEMQAVYESILSMLEAKNGKKTTVTVKASVAELTEDSTSIDEQDGEVLQAAGKVGLVSKVAYSTEVEAVWNEAVKKGIVERSPNAKMLSKWTSHSDKYATKKIWMDRLATSTVLLDKLKAEVSSK